jgi:hypothetical protein
MEKAAWPLGFLLPFFAFLMGADWSGYFVENFSVRGDGFSSSIYGVDDSSLEEILEAEMRGWCAAIPHFRRSNQGCGWFQSALAGSVGLPRPFGGACGYGADPG